MKIELHKVVWVPDTEYNQKKTFELVMTWESEAEKNVIPGLDDIVQLFDGRRFKVSEREWINTGADFVLVMKCYEMQKV